MSSSSIQSTVAQVTGALMWIADFTGHSPVGTVLHDPRTAGAITAFIAAAIQVYGLAQHLYVAYEGNQAKKTLAAVHAVSPGLVETAQAVAKDQHI